MENKVLANNTENIFPPETSAETKAVSSKETSVISGVLTSIFVDSIRDFFTGVKNFFLRYIRHFWYCFKYLYHPTLRNGALRKLDWKENCKQAFEYALLTCLLLLFFIKLNWVPVTNKESQDLYGNDIAQMLMEVMIFMVFAIFYCVLALFSIAIGRFLKAVFSMPVSKRETDIVFIYLNNAFFTFSVSISFFIRCGTTNEMVAQQGVSPSGIWLTLALLFLFPFLLWGFRFVQLHKLSTFKKLLFVLLIPLFLALFYGFAAFWINDLLLEV